MNLSFFWRYFNISLNSEYHINAFRLGVPFLIIGALAGKIEPYLSRSFAWIQYINILFGGVLVWLGALAFTQNLSVCREVLWNFPF